MQEVSAEQTEEGRYLYSIINSGAELSFGDIGIDDSDVYTIPHKDIAAVAHSCKARPYDTKDDEKVKEWILAHGYVIDQATKKFGTVLPFSFDVIVRGDDNTVKEWLDTNYNLFKGDLDRVEGKAEYSVQIFCDQEKLAEMIVSGDQEIAILKKKIEKMPKGVAYLLQRKLELKIKDGVSGEISRLAGDFGTKIRKHVWETKVEGKPSQVPEKYKDKMLVVALSCLVQDNNVGKLGRVLDEINHREGFAVRFTGPWAPFSFIRLKEA
ncbi:MAG: hypothetical protein D4Q77_00620 [Methanothrix sp.]|nr:MAG: hypothetical protein D4Q77_00620 [Methanothrix sp.]